MRQPLASVIRKGLSNLSAKPATPAKSARFRVTVFYRSQGGEILAMETGPLTKVEACALRSACERTDSDALGCVMSWPDGKENGDWYAEGKDAFGAKRLARTFPQEALTARRVAVPATFERISDSDQAEQQLQIAA